MGFGLCEGKICNLSAVYSLCNTEIYYYGNLLKNLESQQNLTQI